MVKLFSFIFIGGGLGSIARFGLARILAQCALSAFPFTTLLVNILGSLLIGFFWAIPAISEKNQYIHFLIVGFCGGFTTFSAFSWENFNLLKQGDMFLFFVYTFSSVTLCLLATWGGYTIGKCL